ncbi:MAG: M23 family metallopeptidase [Cyanobacteria bacterium J06650_10]
MRILKRLLLAATICISFLIFIPLLGAAQVTEPNPEYSVVNATFNSLPNFETGGVIERVDMRTVESMGYDPSRTWEAGQRPADVVKVGDVDSGLGASELNLSQISEITGFDMSQLTVGNLEFLEGVTLEEFLKDIPFLEDWEASDIPELEQIEGYGQVFSGDKTLGEIVEANPELAEAEVLDVFRDLPIDSIPNLDLASLSDFAGIGDDVLSDIPGLGDVPLGSFPIPVAMPSLNFFPRQDIAFQSKEYLGSKPTPQSVSGGTDGTEIWRPMACSGGCPHIELADNGWEGANWMTKEHRVRDGFGFLGSIFDEAGAYRLPFGSNFALQVTDTEEKTGNANWGLAFRVCKRGIIDLGCTAYFLEVPLGIETVEGDNILTGIRDGLGGSTVPMDAPPGYEDLRPDIPPELQGYVGVVAGGYGVSLCGDGPGGVKMEALATAFHQIESLGAGGYEAVGIFVNLSPTEIGRALGKYQYMSYREDVVAAIGSTPAGAELIRVARSGQKPTADQVLRGFPPEDQDALFMRDQTNNIETLIARGYEGGRIIEILGQMHIRGAGVLDNGDLDSTTARDGLGTSVKAYGEKFLEYYLAAEAKLPDGDENERCKSTGEFINPSADGIKSFSRRFSASAIYNPVTGTNRPHSGDDLLTPQDSLIVASDGGVLEVLQDKCSVGPTCGYGDFVVIVHDNGFETLYAHLSRILIANGSRVKQGQAIANSGGARGVKGSGGSTGSHLHFEVRQNGSPIPPASVVDYNRTVRDLSNESREN